uniref:Secreted protein n=1 Tax=Mesocestoides corti TaxID=53468 RepID=A0A5K3F085_MESCO
MRCELRIRAAGDMLFYFDIALSCLRLASNAAFLSSWTELFWSLFLTEAVLENAAAAKFNDVVVPSGPTRSTTNYPNIG